MIAYQGTYWDKFSRDPVYGLTSLLEIVMQLLDRVFLAHPHTVGETYLQHCAFALRIGARLLAAGSAALIHAVVPCLCQTTASRIILAMNADIVARRAKSNQVQTPTPSFGFAEYI
ncbi:DUF6356 family protein [Dongia deserti]|uniref:DUF6356 family protein n=1 Tax=Dongia deserti TaxID=2268030 RepID=UPI002546CD36|nr:DUF6356 family protein [Dongia deserti]